MHGPDIQWYVVLAALLFCTGALGVMLRRNPLIILLSVEIMLNSANLLLIAFSRLHGREDGQIFAISVMAVAASEVVVGLGLIVAMGRRHVELEVSRERCVGCGLCASMAPAVMGLDSTGKAFARTRVVEWSPADGDFVPACPTHAILARTLRQADLPSHDSEKLAG